MNKLKKVEKKYFPEEQELNLLTWSAKEQIRYLHHTDPQQWTPEHIAECFPISPEGAKASIAISIKSITMQLM